MYICINLIYFLWRVRAKIQTIYRPKNINSFCNLAEYSETKILDLGLPFNCKQPFLTIYTFLFLLSRFGLHFPLSFILINISHFPWKKCTARFNLKRGPKVCVSVYFRQSVSHSSPPYILITPKKRMRFREKRKEHTIKRSKKIVLKNRRNHRFS